MTGSPNRQVQERFVAAVFAGDAETLRSLCAPDFVLHEGSGLPFAGAYHGAEGFLAFLGLFSETFDIEELAPVRHYGSDDPDWLATEFSLRATLRATGAPFVSSLVEVWNFTDGKVASIKPHYFNAV